MGSGSVFWLFLVSQLVFGPLLLADLPIFQVQVLKLNYIGLNVSDKSDN